MDRATFEAVLTTVRGGLSVRKAIIEHNADRNDFYRYVDRVDGAASQYAGAREACLDAMADEVIELSDTALVATKTRETKDGTFVETGDNVERTRLQIDARKWLLSKLAPKKYGERLNVEQDVTIHLEKELAERLEDGRKRLTLVGESKAA